MTAPVLTTCGRCGAELAPGVLTCLSCGALVHTARLRELAQAAASAESAGDVSKALGAWREALTLLPPETQQYHTIVSKIAALSSRVHSGEARPPWWKRVSSLGPLGVVAAGLGKAKFLLLGFGKLGTLLSFLATFGVYWTLWGWKFALCFLLSIYIHEMGHVAALSRYGVPATAPTFIPGFGALIRLKQHPASAIEDARVGLAGPIWGLGAGLLWFGLYVVTGQPFWVAMMHATAWLNLFNLIPVWQLDGSRGTRSLDRTQTALLAAVAGLAWLVSREGMLIILALALAYRAYSKHDDTEPDWNGCGQFAGLIAALTLLSMLPL
ncbi:MAG TPA: site-2 protease family protein [Solibacterales bacterium]|nr:site-2 protease family protein [Bryobacterales bacterium]